MSERAPVRVCILTVSDGVAAGVREDVSGDTIAGWAAEQGHQVADRAVVADETDAIQAALTGWADAARCDLVVTTGGTGFGPRDVTPEATRGVIARDAPGIAERIRADGSTRTPFAILGRGAAGIRGRTLIVNLPGSPGGVRDGLDSLSGIVQHAVDILRGSTVEHQTPDAR